MTGALAAQQDGPDARAALARLFGCSGRQAVLSAAMALAFGTAAYARHAYAWLGLFGAILLPLLLATLALMAARPLLPARWRWQAAWLVLLAALCAGAAVSLALYQRWMEAFALSGLADLKVLATAFGVGLPMLGLPLWHAQSQARARHLADLRQAALAAQLNALQAQVEPHFLYNALANTRYLAGHDPGRAVQMLDHLIAYLHSAMPDMRVGWSTLGREFELAGHYLAVMAIRFGPRLSFRLDFAPALAGARMPPLMLMTLVENAVKHGLEPHPGPVCIGLSADGEGGCLRITVSDDGAGPAPALIGSGVGLRNLRERLAALFGESAGFNLERSAAGGTEAHLRLPLKIEEA